MKKISFRPGYYEWHLIIDDKIIYTFGDLEFNELFTTKKELRDFVKDAISVINDEANDEMEIGGFCDYYGTQQENKEIWLSLTEEERKTVAKILYAAWVGYCLTPYENGKNKAKDEVMAYRFERQNRKFTRSEITKAKKHFTELGKKYGLLREFRKMKVI